MVYAKERRGDDRVLTKKEGECKGKHVIIVDDLVRTGGTLEECRKALMEDGALKVSCFVTHAVFPPSPDPSKPPTWNRFLSAGKDPKDCFSYFFVTNSCPMVTNQLTQKPFKVVSLASSIAEMLRKEERQDRGYNRAEVMRVLDDLERLKRELGLTQRISQLEDFIRSVSGSLEKEQAQDALELLKRK